MHDGILEMCAATFGYRGVWMITKAVVKRMLMTDFDDMARGYL
jgi:hypothetical protein